ncbi:MAG TPA: hypothetical protein VL947_10845, partial [Cytophagales bacterium]|nr:hypothetical protein [Cytophagales bacterium]
MNYTNTHIKRFFTAEVLSCFLMICAMVAQGQPTCPRTTGAELVKNGDFKNGNVDFTSGYTYSASSVMPGSYSVGTNPSTLNTAFANIPDHTPDANGNMLIMDVDATVGKNVYTTQVNVVQGRTYFFSAWFANINTNTGCATCSVNPPKYENAPQLRFAIEGVTVGTIVRVDSTNHGWTQFNTSWTALSTGAIDISIQNLRNLPNGNDLALDDISFKAGCDGITDLSRVGKTSTLRDTIYSCNENFSLDLNTGLNNNRHAFNWYQASALQGPAGIKMDDQKEATSSATFPIGAAPANGTKYYVCYDSLGDGITCARLDSVIFLNEFDLSLGPDRLVCPPVSELLDPSLTTTNISSYTYERTAPTAAALTSGAGPGTVPPLTVNKAGTYRLTVAHANASCGTKIATLKIDTVAASFTGAINASCTNGVATGTVTLVPKISGPGSVTIIGGQADVSWFQTITGNSPAAVVTMKSADGVTTTAASNLITTNTSCPQGGLYLQDNNSFPTSIQGGEACASAPDVLTGNRTFTKIRSVADFTLKSLDIYTKANNGQGEAIDYQVLIYKTLPNSNALGTPDITGPVNTVQVTATSVAAKEKHTIIGPNDLLLANTDYYIVVDAKTKVGAQQREIGF